VHYNGKFPQRFVLNNVDGNGTPLVGSNISNGRGTPYSTQEDLCTMLEELVHAASDKPPVRKPWVNKKLQG